MNIVMAAGIFILVWLFLAMITESEDGELHNDGGG